MAPLSDNKANIAQMKQLPYSLLLPHVATEVIQMKRLAHSDLGKYNPTQQLEGNTKQFTFIFSTLTL